MQTRICTVVFLAMLGGGGLETAEAFPPSRLAQLSARQELRDQVCIAKADGQISPSERCRILGDAKRILKPEEYATFRQAINRLSPPEPMTVGRTTKAMRPVKLASKQAPTSARVILLPPPPRPKSPATAIVPIETIMTGEVVSTIEVR